MLGIEEEWLNTWKKEMERRSSEIECRRWRREERLCESNSGGMWDSVETAAQRRWKPFFSFNESVVLQTLKLPKLAHTRRDAGRRAGGAQSIRNPRVTFLLYQFLCSETISGRKISSPTLCAKLLVVLT